jgi:mediator of RNA polymerase II transcription subunit 7
MDQDEAEAISVVPPASQPDATDVTTIQDEISSKPPSPQPQLSMSLQTSSQLDIDLSLDTLDASLDPLDTDMAHMANIDVGVTLGEKDGLVELDMTGLGPDGLGLESSHDLSQMDDADILVGGAMMPQTDDPFAETLDG